MFKYDEGLAQGHTRKEQAEVKPGISDSASVACPISWLLLFASDTCNKKQEAMEFGLLGRPPISYKEVTLLEDPTG